jgi:alginate O-acetyltransferase complex protein AlgI
LRDYLYIPLGGNRVAGWRVVVNLFTVFLLCGWWHGASWNFIIWGAWHGLFLVLERGRFGRIVNSLPFGLQHLYVFLVVIIGWVFFRTDNMGQATAFFTALAGQQGFTNSLYPLQLYISSEAIVAGIAGVILATPVFTRVQSLLSDNYRGYFCRMFLFTILLYGSFMKISSGTYNPFLYFRF